jgi:transposase-like protein
MKKQTRRKFSPEFKAKVAIEAIKEQLTLAHLSEKFEVNPVTISKWKSEFLANASAAFSASKDAGLEESTVPVEKLYAQIGQLKVELDFLKKSARKLGIPEQEWKP